MGAKFSEKYKRAATQPFPLKKAEKTRVDNKDDSEIPLDERGQRTRIPLQSLFIDFFSSSFSWFSTL